MSFRVDLDVFRGPLDLLLYLVRKHELDVIDIRISALTEQFLEHIAVLAQIDIDSVGDFLDVASQLIEMKSRATLPSEEEVVAELEDPREELVVRLLAYKQYRDAASMLEERSRTWSERFARAANDLPDRVIRPDDQPIGEVELWDLVSAFGRVLQAKQALNITKNIRYDETPIQVYMRRIDERLRRNGRMAFTAFFESAVHKSALVGMFLAVLELVRHHHSRASQDELFGEIWLEPGERPLPDPDAAVVDYEHGSAAVSVAG